MLHRYFLIDFEVVPVIWWLFVVVAVAAAPPPVLPPRPPSPPPPRVNDVLCIECTKERYICKHCLCSYIFHSLN